jgi:YagB/YeeU/YfjZ family.
MSEHTQIEWGLPRSMTPRFSARLIQSGCHLDFLADRAGLIGDWTTDALQQLERTFPEFIKQLEGTLRTGELDPQKPHCVILACNGLRCEADTLGSYGYVYLVIYPCVSSSNPESP